MLSQGSARAGSPAGDERRDDRVRGSGDDRTDGRRADARNDSVRSDDFSNSSQGENASSSGARTRAGPARRSGKERHAVIAVSDTAE